jgi:20S proteasome alpha/beta subunit
MTVVLALRCADGMVVGADSQITDAARGLSYPARKLHPLGGTAAWGGSGARAVLTELEGLFDANPAAVLEAGDVGHALQERVLPVLRHHYATFIPEVPGQEAGGATPATFVLAAGYTEAGPFLVDVDPHGLIGRYEEVGFHAIGSGAAMALQAGALLAQHRMTERDVDRGVVAAVRVLDALDRTSPSVGGPMNICRITPEGAHHLDDKEVDQAREKVRRWLELEDRALDELFDQSIH